MANIWLSVNPLTRFSNGFFAPFRAGKFLIGHPRLYPYIIIPLIINVLVFSLTVYLGFNFFNDTVVELIPRRDAWYWAALSYFLWTCAVLLTAVLVFFLFSVVGNLIAAPFNDILSEKTEAVLRGTGSDDPWSWRGFVHDVRRTVGDELKKLGIFIAAMVVILLLNLIPLAGSVLYAVLSLLLTLFFLALEYTGFVFSRKRLGFAVQRQYLLSRKALMGGFSVGVLVLLTIPLLQFFCIPVAVVAATRLYCAEDLEITAGDVS
ncbi:MAG: sulfate transporter CysZ [Desulfuromonadaceae bacterium]|nr:sulfate transporter CysZ [Desulfuromonadaceae bacterium]